MTYGSSVRPNACGKVSNISSEEKKMGGGEEGRHEYLFKNELALLALIHVKHLLI